MFRTTDPFDERREIERVLLEYCRAVDANEPDAVVRLFIDDCVTNYGSGKQRAKHPVLGFQGEMHGRAAFRESLNGLSGLVRTSHHLSNVEIALTGLHTAEAFSYVIAWHLLPSGTEFTVYGRYVDVLVKTGEGWRFRSRRMLVAGTSGPATGPWEMLSRK